MNTSRKEVQAATRRGRESRLSVSSSAVSRVGFNIALVLCEEYFSLGSICRFGTICLSLFQASFGQDANTAGSRPRKD